MYSPGTDTGHLSTGRVCREHPHATRRSRALLTAQVPRDEDCVAVDDEAVVGVEQRVGDAVLEPFRRQVAQLAEDREPGRRQHAAVVELQRQVPVSQSLHHHAPHRHVQLNTAK